MSWRKTKRLARRSPYRSDTPLHPGPMGSGVTHELFGYCDSCPGVTAAQMLAAWESVGMLDPDRGPSGKSGTSG